MATTAATLVVKVVSDTKQAVAGVDNVAKSTSTWKDKVGQASKVATVGLVALGGAAIYAGKAAAEDAKSQAVLAASMKSSAGATAGQVKATEDFIAKTALATGVADDELRPAMGNLVRATGDVEKSQKAMSIALDISAATGKDVETVTAAMAKGYGGNESALNRLLPAVTKTAEKTGDFDAVMRKAAKTTKGAAAAGAETAAGKMQRMQVAMDEATESLGAALLPAMAILATVLGKVAVFVQDNSRAVQVLVGIIAALAAAIVVLNYALKAYVVVTKVIGVVQKATWLSNPIFLVIAAVIALGVAIVVLWKKSETFRRIVLGVWGAIKKAFSAVVNFIKKHWKTMLALLLGPLGIAVRLIIKHWDKIKSVAKKAWDTIGDLGRKLKSILVAVFSSVADKARAVWDKIKDGARALKDAVVGFFRSVFDGWRNVGEKIREIARNVWDAIKSGARAVKDAVVGFFRNILEPVRGIFSTLRTIASSAFDRLKDAARTVTSVIVAPFNKLDDAVRKVIDAVESLISWIGKIDFPDVGGFVDKIPGLGSFAAPAPTVASPRVGRFAAPRVAGVGARTAVAGGGGIVINVNGAIDPENTARQIRRILDGHDRRVGLRTA